MRLSYVPQILNKKERQTIVVVSDSFIEQSAECWLRQNFDTPTYGLACVVNGKIVDWSHIPAKDDDVIFVQKLGEASFWTMVVVMVVSMVMSMVMSLLFAPDMPGQQTEDSDTYGWDGIKNIIGEGNVMPVVYGRHAIGGIIIEGFIDGNIESGIQKRKYLNALIGLSEGEVHEIETDTIKINQTELSEFANDAQFWTRTGMVDQEPIDAFSVIARHISISGNVKITKVSGGYVYKTTGVCDKITVNTQFQSLFRANDKGGLDNISVNISILYAHESDKNSWYPLTSTTATAKSKSSVEHQITGVFPTKGVYYIKIRRETDDFTSSKESGDMYLRAVTEYENAKLAYPSTALLGVKLTATDKLSGSMPSISVTIKGRKIKDVRNLNSPPLVEHMGNPANIIYDLLTNDLYGLGRHVKPEQIDIESFKDFAEWCDELVTFKKWNSFWGRWDEYQQKRYVFNLVLDKPDKASDVITKIAASCRSKIYWSGSKVKVVTDKPSGGVYAQIFSMSNIVADSFEETYIGIAEVPGQVEVQILDEEDNFKRATIVAVDKSRLENTTSKTINMYGITDKARAKREALYSMKYMVATRKNVKFASSVQAIICEVGDIILFQHDVPQYGFGGHIVGKYGNQVTLNTAVPIESGKSYRLRIRKQDNSYVLYTIVASATTQTVNLDCGMAIDSGIEPGNIFQFGEILQDGTTLEAKPFRVVSITKGDEYKVVLECEEYNESVFDEDDTIEIKDVNYSALGVAAKYQVDGLITDPDLRNPEFVENPVVNQNTGEIPPFVTDVTIEEELILMGNVYKPTIAVWFSPVYMPENSLAYISKYVVTYSKDGGASWINAGVATGNFFRISDVEVGETYHVLVKPVTNYFVTNQVENSIHALSNYLIIQGKVALPSTPTGLTATPGTFLCDLQWPALPDSDYRHMEIWCASGVNNRASAVLAGTSSGTRFKHTGVYQDTTYYYWIRAVDTTGNIGEFYPTSGIGGVACTPANDPSKVLDLLHGSITESQLSAELQAAINSESGIQAVEELLENQWTVKINENGHVAGVGIIMYPEWSSTTTYALGYAVEGANGLFYKSLQANNTNHEPSVSPTWWGEIPYGTKSEFIVVADKFAIVNPASPSQPAKTPFVVGTVNGVSAVGIDGDMVVDGTIGADKIITDELIVGDNIQMGENAVLSWGQINGTGKPEDNATVGAPPGTSVGATPVENIEGAIINFNNRNDRNPDPIQDPSLIDSPISYNDNGNGTANIKITWSTSEPEENIDGWLVAVRVRSDVSEDCDGTFAIASGFFKQ